MMSHGMLVLQYNKLDPGESRVIFKRYDVGEIGRLFYITLILALRVSAKSN